MLDLLRFKSYAIVADAVVGTESQSVTAYAGTVHSSHRQLCSVRHCSRFWTVRTSCVSCHGTSCPSAARTTGWCYFRMQSVVGGGESQRSFWDVVWSLESSKGDHPRHSLFSIQLQHQGQQSSGSATGLYFRSKVCTPMQPNLSTTMQMVDV